MNTKMTFGVQNLFSMASRERCMLNFRKLPVPNPSQRQRNTPIARAAVLVPMCRVDDVASLLYTFRSSEVRTDSNHVSFPGGKSDKDETPIQTALRETQEEIGLSPTKIDVWGSGPSFPGRGNKIIVTPVVGCITDLKSQDLRVNIKEVSEVFAISIETLCDSKNHYYTQFRNGYILPVFVAEKYKIWGLTAYITHSFLSCLLPKDVYRNDWMKKKIVIKDQISE